MKHPVMLLLAALVTVVVVSVSAFPARTAPQAAINWDGAPPQTVQSAGVHALVGASFHAVSAGF
jgi:hypothetical protein